MKYKVIINVTNDKENTAPVSGVSSAEHLLDAGQEQKIS